MNRDIRKKAEQKPKDDPSNWINRPMNDYFKIKNDLCVTAIRFANLRELHGKYVTDSKEGMTLILCRYVKQGDEELAVPVEINEGKSWNVPVSAMIKKALQNMPAVFPASVRDMDTGNIFIPELVTDENEDAQDTAGIYSFDTSSESLAAENQDFYENKSSSRLRFIVNASSAIGEALLFYPGLLAKLGDIVGMDPLILSAAPGKLYIFDSTSRRNSLNAYLKRYMERFSSDSFEPHMYKYYRANRIVYDITPVSASCRTMLKNAHIPQGSVVSAWGDVNYRCRIFELNRSK